MNIKMMSKIFFIINLVLKIVIILISLPIFLINLIVGLMIFQNFFNPAGFIIFFLTVSLPFGIVGIIIIAGFVLWFYIAFCGSANKYQKFKKYYIVNIIAELIVIDILLTVVVLIHESGTYSSRLFLFIMSIITCIIGIIYFILKRDFLFSLEYKTSKENLEKLKDILKVSTKIKLERVQNVLDLDDKTFNSKIIEWAKEYGFKIDGEYLITPGESVEKFVGAVEKQFAEWEQLEKRKEGKI